MALSFSSSLSSFDSFAARSLVSVACMNATSDVNFTAIEIDAQENCGYTEKLDDDFEAAVDLCDDEGSEDECDAIAEMVKITVCIEKSRTDGFATALKDDCEKADIDYILKANGRTDLTFDLKYFEDERCGGGEITHVCLAGENPVLDLAKLEEEGNELADGEDAAPTPTNGEDSAAGLVAFAGVSLAAAAMLA